MTISMITFLLYGLVIGILFIRFWRLMTAGTDMWIDPNISPIDKLVLNGYGFRGKLWKFVCDVFFSFTLAGLFASFIPGIAGGPVGALAGLWISSILTGGSSYARWRKRKFQQQGQYV